MGTFTSRRDALRVFGLAGLGIAAGLPASAIAQEQYPSRPIEFIVPWGPGGGADQVARQAGKMLEEILKVSFPVINVPGASGQTGLNKMLVAPNDGYTISIMTGDTFGTQAAGKPNWKFSDIVPVAIMIKQPSAFFVPMNSPLKTFEDLAAEARKRPLKVAVTGFGTPDDITVNYFTKRGVSLQSVPFAKPGERYTAILGGHADLLYEQLGDVKNFLETKQMRPIVLFDTKRFPAFPDVQTCVEVGHPVIINQFRMVTAKAGTDPKKVKVLADALAKVAAAEQYKAYLKDQYADPNSYQPADAAQGFLQSELDNMRKFAREAGMAH
ncbi:MAG TPA: tripartite tricarboxylate transporter substrate binding protein [Burkholderiaceae bacterium]|jgi:tripartite-type tricarboxylate transporter receptor subunit TctC|nr:tripartite tricarboxylate transporter substrate binding protein [Burkholderiaceae bacterium]